MGAAVLVAALVLVSVALLNREPESGWSASSAQTGQEAVRAEPGVSGAWASRNQTVGAWVERSWRSPVDVQRVVITRGDAASAPVTAGYVRFGDGSQLRVELTGPTTIVPIAPRRISVMRFTVLATDEGASFVSLAELGADDETASQGSVAAPSGSSDGNLAGAATASGDLDAVIDGNPSTSAAVGDGLELTWDQPQEISRVSILGAPEGPTMRSGTLEFSDGSTLPFGGVTSDVQRPTTAAFMPRVTTSLRLRVDGVNGVGDPGALTLGEVAVYGSGGQAVRPPGRAEAGATPGTAPCAQPGPRPADGDGIVVLCPTNGTVVEDAVDLTVAAGPSFSSVTASVWPSATSTEPPGASSEERVRIALDADGTGSLTLDVSSISPGPFTVALATDDPGEDRTTAFLHLLKAGVPQSDDSPAPPGRTLAFAEEFDRPVSVNRSGEGADYAAGKPTDAGIEDFGEAIFADPALGLGNVEVVQDDYLRLSVQPRPSNLEDPQGWGREYVGGMLSSARSGGSGFSAQYGYFEARMLAPAAPGTWPAFWLLPNPDLVDKLPVGLEIDVVELYGHDPVGACHTSHQYPDPDGIGKALCAPSFGTLQKASQWHTYGVDVRPDRIVYFIDGEQVADAPPVAAMDEPMFFMLDLALGGGWPLDLSSLRGHADLYVDWVRVFV